MKDKLLKLKVKRLIVELGKVSIRNNSLEVELFLRCLWKWSGVQNKIHFFPKKEFLTIKNLYLY